jgi:tyrosyl-tRNA synthetase
MQNQLNTDLQNLNSSTASYINKGGITQNPTQDGSYNAAIEASEILFGKGTAEALAKIDEATFLAVFEGVPTFNLNKNLLDEGVQLEDLLVVHTNIFPSKGEARKNIIAGAVSLNKNKMLSNTEMISTAHLINSKYLLLQKGKKNNYLVIVE